MGTVKQKSNKKTQLDKDHDGKLTFDEILKVLDFDESKYNGTSEEIIDENMNFYREVYSKKVTEPKFAQLTYNEVYDETGLRRVLTKDEYPRSNATLLTLVRNQELKDIVHTIRQIESTWNHNFHYPYTFISDEEFTQEFKDTVKRHTSGDCFFEIIPQSIWSKPSNIDPEREKLGIQKLIDNGVQYASMESYHNMCRFNSGWFYRLEGLKKFKWYWRFEPKTDYYCSIDYDIFKFMEDNDKTYGFTISLYDDPLTVETLWPVTMEFIKQNPQYVNPNGAFNWLTDSVQNPEYTRLANGYSTCHFWSNFEIADMDFYRGEAYSKWIDALEEAGGFYYERWGDAPVHSVGVALFEDKSKIHWFRDIGYHHSPYKSIPNSDKCSAPEDSGYFAPEDVYSQNCLSNWIKYEMTYKELQQY
ncbi:glycosyltransferase family 15 protein [[Candida] arabinofermentans NRRL YB-2248]|uniref:Glycosyltransferase family 15 protein n=1 Tax=[Candida] arabinofermentans NRRL YB-2248 TaxID=983967 RepID=A0A1E4T1W4_9ASCO|nr:glycosyltransferase family 15 protein [[Candida] arabinofermentans NRRL YB-2248]